MNINFVDIFESAVCRNRDKTAVVHKDEKITFGELRERAVNASHCLNRCIENAVNTPVAVFLPKEINTVIADLAAMYSAEPFMNLDVKTPRDRIKNTLDTIRPCAVITSRKYAANFDEMSIPVLFIEEMTEAPENCGEIIERHTVLIDTDPFCIINTSGSTGTPKGVVLNHRSFFDFMYWSVERFGFDGSEVMGSLSPVVFDIFDFELCMMMMCGSTIVLLDASLAAFPVRLLEALNKNNVSFIFWVPSIMVNIANMKLLDSVSVPSLRLIWFAGEVFPSKQFLYWYDHLPHAKFVNLYGPIEITLDCTYHVIEERPEESDPLPIGIPCRNTDILILDGDDKKCSAGIEGELCVRGTSLAMGYYNNPEKTAAAFTQNPLNSSYPELIYRTGDIVCMDENGLIHFKGRKDSLIKHMGYRIELSEIEHILINSLKLVKYCCAVYHYSKKEIVLYYENENEISAGEFRKALKEYLPAYMIPGVYNKMELLPRNTNGKIDRLTLKNLINSED
ncbi:MAG: amino acid adenylation domain-containing protein [Huintestinicola sp.]